MNRTRNRFRWGLLAVSAIVLLLSACAGLPAITATSKDHAQQATERCAKPFLDRPYRLVHAMEVGVAGEPQGKFMGITLFDPRSRDLHCALLSLEGFVLFEAFWNTDGLRVLRAVPPFDKPRFAENTLKDIRFMFIAPEGALKQSGTREDGATVCRYGSAEGGAVDVAVYRDDSWEITTYGPDQKPQRRARARAVRNGIPDLIEMTGYAVLNYSLGLSLISAEPASAEDVSGGTRGQGSKK